MSIGTIYEKAYKGDFNQVKVKIDSEKPLITAPDTVSIKINLNDNISKKWLNSFTQRSFLCCRTIVS